MQLNACVSCSQMCSVYASELDQEEFQYANVLFSLLKIRSHVCGCRIRGLDQG
jgi:hypothetical protein